MNVDQGSLWQIWPHMISTAIFLLYITFLTIPTILSSSEKGARITKCSAGRGHLKGQIFADIYQQEDRDPCSLLRVQRRLYYRFLRGDDRARYPDGYTEY